MSSTPLSCVLKMLNFMLREFHRKKKIPVNGILGAIYELEKGSAWPAASGCPTGSGVPERPSSLLMSKAVPRVSREEKILHHRKQVISKWTQLTL